MGLSLSLSLSLSLKCKVSLEEFVSPDIFRKYQSRNKTVQLRPAEKERKKKRKRKKKKKKKKKKRPRKKKKMNKAGYTANTSRGRVGRSENAGFSTFRLVLTDGPTDGRTKPL